MKEGNWKIENSDGESLGEVKLSAGMPCKELYKSAAQNLGEVEDNLALYHEFSQIPNDSTPVEQFLTGDKKAIQAVPKKGTGWGFPPSSFKDRMSGLFSNSNSEPEDSGPELPSIPKRLKTFSLSYEEAVSIFDRYEGEKAPTAKRRNYLNHFKKQALSRGNQYGVVPVPKSPSRIQFRAKGFKVDIVIPRGAPATRYVAFCNRTNYHHVYDDYVVCIKFDTGPFSKSVCPKRPCEKCDKVCKRSLLQYLIEVLDVIRNPNRALTPAETVHFRKWKKWGVKGVR